MQEHSKVHLKHSMVDNGAAMEDSLFPFIGDNYNSFVRTSDEEQSDHEVDSMPECQIDLTEVDVYTRLEHKERDLILAAELGKSLLEKNEFLTRENERVQNEFQDRCEILEQQKHELRQRLKFKESEWDANSAQLNSDIKRAQEELEEHKAMLCAAEREKSRAVDELTQQNQKLLSQLQKSCEAERQLSIQVQQLRREFLQRTSSANVKIVQLENLKEQYEKKISEGTESRVHLETCYVTMKDESSSLTDALTVATERTHQLERQLHEKERELKRVSVELDDTHILNRQLQIRVDELREEMSLQMSYNSNGVASSLFSELEQSGISNEEILELGSSMTSQNFADENQVECIKSLYSVVDRCHGHIIELKQEMWEVYQRVNTITTTLRSFVNSPDTTSGSMSIMSALDNLSNLVHEAIQFKTTSSTNDEFVEMLKQKQSTLLLERDEAVAIKNALEVNLARAKVDLMAVNSQLLEAISQKLQQQKELEAWQDDMEQMIQKALNERNEQQKVNALRRIQATSPNQSKSWFFRRTRHNSEDSEKSSGSATSEPKTPQPSRFSSWLRRKPNPDVDMSSSTGDAVS